MFFCLVTIALFFPASAFCGFDRLVDNKEYKEKKLKKCIIKDYADAVSFD